MADAHRAGPLQPSDPERLGVYRLLGRLGAGGMGVVFLAEDPGGTRVAIKLIHPGLVSDPEISGRFRSEVGRARQVPAFCTAAFLDADLDHVPPYLVVEYVDGPSLAQVVAEHGPLDPDALRALAVGVAMALTGIHGAGVIHRDLKPGNVLLAADSPRVIDFGIARPFEVTSQHTRTDMMVGTVAYMAPERFTGEPSAPVTPAADVFAWGCLIVYAASGRTPFRGDSPQATAARILTQPPRLDGLPDFLHEPVSRALAKDAADRPTAAQLLSLLVGERRQTPDLTAAGRATAEGEAAEQQAGRKRRRLPAVIAAAVGVAAVATTLGLTRNEPDAGSLPAAPPPAQVLTPAPKSAGPPSAAAPSLPVPSGPSASVRPSVPLSRAVRPSSPSPVRAGASKRAAPASEAGTNTAGRNLALNRPVAASGVESDHFAAARAVDGDPESRWGSAFTEPQWLRVDLGGPYEVGEVELRWEHAHAVAYRVELSVDGEKWTSIFSTSSGAGGVVTVNARSTPARYVRVYCLERSNQYGFSLWEVEVR